MSAEVKPIPDGYHTLTPSLIISGATEAIEFYKKAFGAQEVFRMPTPDGKIAHAEIKIGDSTVFICDEFKEMGAKSPHTLGGTPASFCLYVEDADAGFARAVEAGATPLMPVEEAFWGDRFGMVTDPFGHAWAFATHVKDLTPEEVARASAEYFNQASAAK